MQTIYSFGTNWLLLSHFFLSTLNPKARLMPLRSSRGDGLCVCVFFFLSSLYVGVYEKGI